MSDTATATPPAPSGAANAEALLQSAANLARSPLEDGAMDWVPESAPQPQPDKGLASGQDDYQRRFDAARSKDNVPNQRKPAQQQTAQPPPGEQSGQQAPGEQQQPENPLQFKRRTAQDWEQVKKSHQQREQQLLGEIEQLKKGGVPAGQTGQQAQAPSDYEARLQALQKERDEYFEVVKLTRAEQDPDFKARFDTRRNAAINQAKFAAGGAAEKIASILNQPPSEFRDAALAEATKDFSDSTKARINAAAGILTQIDVERQVELETRAKTWEQRVAQEQQQSVAQTRQREAEMKSAFQKELRRWQDPESGMPFTIPNDNNPAVKAIADAAEAIAFGRLKDEREVAAVSIKAATFDHVVNYAAQLAGEYDTLKAAYDRAMGLQPDSQGYVPSPQVGTGPSNAGPGHGTPLQGTTPLLLQGADRFQQELNARRTADASRR